MRADSDIPLLKLKVDGGVTNSDHAMQIQADIGGFTVERPQMRECVSDTSYQPSALVYC